MSNKCEDQDVFRIRVHIVVAVLSLLIFFLKELVLSAISVFITVLAPNGRLRPGIVAVPLDLKKDWEIVLLSNMITLTPGTLTLDISTDKKAIYVHAMWIDTPDKFRHSIKSGFEKRILALSAEAIS